jgi:pimeloyl-ACP methyl ester carboxylesterase
VFEAGASSGEALVFLHDIDYLNGADYAFIEALAKQRRVLAPSHPGFGASSLPEDFDCVEDVALVYLDWLKQFAAAVHLVGAGFGGWIAAEMAVRCAHHIRSLTLVDALGIKVGDRTTVDIQDLFVLGAPELVELCWHDPQRGEREMPLPAAGKGFDEDTLTLLLSQRRTAALMGWNPFMHNPKLLKRLRRIDRPSLVIWGASDRLVTPDYGRAYAQAIPGAQFVIVDNAGHYPYLEQPIEFTATLEAFLKQA